MASVQFLSGKRILLVIAGGIAAYKSLDLIRRAREHGASVRAVLTAAATQFITPLSVAALTEDKVYQDLFSLTDESEMGHIRLSRMADVVVLAPATANILAKLAHGLCDDLATTALLAADKPILAAPAMNHRMWHHPATQANLHLLTDRGVRIVPPTEGSMACGEHGIGRMAEPADIIGAVATLLADTGCPETDGIPPADGRLRGRRALVTSGPTREPIDPVRYISNHSSGRQGHAIAAALAAAGAEVVLVSGPTLLPDPPDCRVVRVETARDMLAACQTTLPRDIVVCAAAVADWRVESDATQKIKKGAGGPPVLHLVENPDILATLAAPGPDRPTLVVGFAAETETVLEHARAKRVRKRCDWIVANDVSPATGTFGGTMNTVHLLRGDTVDSWPPLDKDEVARRLVAAVADRFAAATVDPG